MFAIQSAICLMLIHGIPLVLMILPFALRPDLPVLLGSALLGPIVYTVAFVLVAGLLSLPHQRSVIPGRFPRNTGNPVYRSRRLYGLCWTCVYYHKPLYFVCLSVPVLKALLFRLFGYRGSLDFMVYPDTWIRDLPLLEIHEGAYLSNRATLGTNLPLRDGTILVDRIRIGRHAVVGHLSMVAAGSSVEDGAEIGPGCEVGIRTRIGSGAVVGGNSCVSHRATVGRKSRIGISAHVGTAATVGDEVSVPEGAVVLRGAHPESPEARLRANPRRTHPGNRRAPGPLGHELKASGRLLRLAVPLVLLAATVSLPTCAVPNSAPAKHDETTVTPADSISAEPLILLPSRVLNKLSTRRLRAIPIDRLPDETFAELTDGTLSRLSVKQIRMLGEKTAILDGESVNSLSPLQVRALEVPRLTVAAVSGISARHMRMFTPEQLRSMTVGQVRALRQHQLGQLLGVQLAAVYRIHAAAAPPTPEQAGLRR